MSNNKVFFIIDDAVSCVVDAEHADAYLAELNSDGFAKKIEMVSKEEFKARGHYYYEETPPKEFLYEGESIDFSACDEDE